MFDSSVCFFSSHNLLFCWLHNCIACNMWKAIYTFKISLTWCWDVNVDKRASDSCLKVRGTWRTPWSWKPLTCLCRSRRVSNLLKLNSPLRTIVPNWIAALLLASDIIDTLAVCIHMPFAGNNSFDKSIVYKHCAFTLSALE